MDTLDELSPINSQRKLVGCGCIIIIGLVFFTYFLIYHQPVIFLSTSLQVWYTIQQKVKQPTYINRDHGFCGPCPLDKQYSNAWQLTDLIARISPDTPFLLNIGAASAGGGLYDPTYPLLTHIHSSFAALLIDPITDPSLFSAYPNRTNIHISHDFIWSESIVQDILQKYNISKHFTLLKLDIDSYECSVLETILQAGYQPKVIHTEFNPIFPPPVIFMPIYNATTKNDWKPSLWMNNGPFYGCSLSALSNLLREFDYVLLEVDFWDVIYMKRELAESRRIQVPVNDEVAYRHGFLGHSCFPYCRENRKLYNHHIDSAIKSAGNLTNATTYLKNVVDLFAPISVNTNLRHPYIIRWENE